MQAGTNTTNATLDGFDDLDRLLSLERTAQLLSVSIWTVRKWVSIGRIKSVKIGSRRLVAKSEVQRITSEGLAA
ncbi:MAG: helix-turn-helix domain-containing protein [Blastocatellia bacterium]